MPGVIGRIVAVGLAIASVGSMSACNDHAKSKVTGMSVGMLDRNDGDEVYSWSMGVCRYAPLKALADRFGSEPNPEAILKAIGDAFPAATSSEAVAGCKAGFEKRQDDKHGVEDIVE
jgi:hypothetical protein